MNVTLYSNNSKDSNCMYEQVNGFENISILRSSIVVNEILQMEMILTILNYIRIIALLCSLKWR